MSLQDLSDFQIFELQKELISVDNEMREIFSAVTSYLKIASTCGKDKDDMLKEAEDAKKKALDARNSYAMELYNISTSRDISEEKLKNLSGLDIKLEKFQGYDSKTDIFSFKSDFEKRIQPKHQKRFWVDVLKKNYLKALELVGLLKQKTLSRRKN